MKKTRLLAFLLTACLATTCFLSGTVAKYSSTAAGEDSARVAHWSFTVGDSTDIAPVAQTTFTFNLFDTINDTGNTADEGDVADGLIAPGTAGSFVLKIKNTSEVKARYKVDYKVTNEFTIDGTQKTLPVVFSVDNGANWEKTLDDVDWANLTAGASAEDVTILWKWDFEAADSASDDEKAAQDALDTLFGVNSTSSTAIELKVEATITAEQVD